MTPKRIERILSRYRIRDGKGFRLDDHDPGHTGGKAVDHALADTMLAEGVARLAELQGQLYAQGQWSLLCVLQAMDAGGKDGVVKHVMSGVNPQGVRVVSFKAPGPEDLAHDYLWRVHREMPRRGEICIFNRSHYEEVLVTRVHPEILAREHLPPPLADGKLWRHRCEDIAAFERYLGRQGILVVKFFLNISAEEQRRRLLSRLDDPAKTWKFDPQDLAERSLWNDYRRAYEEAIAGTATAHAPWYVVPADHKWYARWVVVEAITAALASLDLRVPPPDERRRAALEAARRELEDESHPP